MEMPLVLSMRPAPVTAIVPVTTVVEPVQVLLPERVSVPVPDLVRPPVP